MSIHLRLHHLLVLLQILDDILLNGPAKEVEFTNRGHKGLNTRQTEHYTLTSAERIKQLLTICLELTLIAHIDHKLLALKEIANAVALGIVRHKPVNEPKAD